MKEGFDSPDLLPPTLRSRVRWGPERLDATYKLGVEHGYADPVVFILDLRDAGGRAFAGLIADATTLDGAAGRQEYVMQVPIKQADAGRLLEAAADCSGFDHLRVGYHLGPARSSRHYPVVAIADGKAEVFSCEIPA